MTINVQVPVLDDNFPRPTAGGCGSTSRPASSTWTAPRRCDYARSRKSTSDFERGARQQRVIVSLREQLDIGQALQNIDAARRRRSASRSRRTSRARSCRSCSASSDRIDTRSIRSVIFTPPFYQVECLNCPPRGYIIQPRVDRIRAAVREAFNIDPAFAEARDALARGGRRAVGPQRLRAHRRGRSPVRVPELPGPGRHGAQPATRHERPAANDGPRLQRRRDAVPADGRGAPSRCSASRSSPSTDPGHPRRLRDHHRAWTPRSSRRRPSRTALWDRAGPAFGCQIRRPMTGYPAKGPDSSSDRRYSAGRRMRARSARSAGAVSGGG